jgi:hypothetical protein
MHLERDRNGNNVFQAFDTMASADGLRGPRLQATAALWREITGHYAVGTDQAVNRMRDAQVMPLVLIDSACADQPLTEEGMNQVVAMMSSSAWVRGSMAEPTGGPFSMFGFSTGGLLAMMDVWAAANTDPNERQPNESVRDWVVRMNPDMSPEAIARLERQLGKTMPQVRSIIAGLEQLGSGEGWRFENGRLVFDDPSQYREVIASMDLSPADRAVLESWLGPVLEGRTTAGPIDVERIGALRQIRDTKQVSKISVNTFAEDLPKEYYYVYDVPDTVYAPGTYSFGEDPGSNSGLLAAIEKADMARVAVQHANHAQQLEVATAEIRERARDLNTYLAELSSDSRKYQKAIVEMNRIVSQWEAKGQALRGPLTADLARGMGLS